MTSIVFFLSTRNDAIMVSVGPIFRCVVQVHSAL